MSEWFNIKLSNSINLPNKFNDHDRDIAHIYNSKCSSFKNNSPISNNIYDVLKKVKKNSNDYINNKNKSIEKINNNEKLTDKQKITKLKTLETKTNKKINNIDTVTKVKHIICYPNYFQKQVFFKWNDECKKVYNETLKYYYQNNCDDSYQSIKVIIFDKLYGKNNKDAPYDMLTDEVRIFFSNLKSAQTNLKNGNIKKFKLKPKSQNNKSFSLLIPLKSINCDGIFTKYKPFNDNRTIGNLITSEPIENIEHDCRLNYDGKLNKFTLSIPYNEKIKEINNRNKIVALDPGEKIFQTFYGTSNYGYFGMDVRKPILQIEGKIRQIQRGLSNNKNQHGEILRNKKQLVNKLRKKYKKIKNFVKELHNKTSLYLCNNYDRIIIPEFKTKQMVKGNRKKQIYKIYEQYEGEERKEKIKELRKKRQLNGRVKFVINMLSHYKFRQHLSHKCEEYGCELIVVQEDYTSMTCTNCGHMSKIYKDRIKDCPKCKIQIDRDLNGSRNILIKTLIENNLVKLD